VCDQGQTGYLHCARSLLSHCWLPSACARLGVMLYDFKAGGEEEISVRAGERLRIHVDMGDWCHVTTFSGECRCFRASPAYSSLHSDWASCSSLATKSQPCAAPHLQVHMVLCPAVTCSWMTLPRLPLSHPLRLPAHAQGLVWAHNHR
jgi:hypothetical protein